MAHDRAGAQCGSEPVIRALVTRGLPKNSSTESPPAGDGGLPQWEPVSTRRSHRRWHGRRTNAGGL